MPIRIDNIVLEVREGETILESAGKAGIIIPTLCHKDGIEHYSSCMVCIVRDMKSGNFIPACTAPSQDGMEIDSSGEEVISLRKKAVELLLSEHRAECEAPCRVVCPAGYNIPKMNRLLAAGSVSSAIDLASAEITTEIIKCTDCPGYCENACRRKKADNPVSIRNIMLFVAGNLKNDRIVKDKEVKNMLRGKFSSRIGKIDDDEFMEWLKESDPAAPRFREIDSFNSAGSEAKSCMHCDCRASEDCMLRKVAIGLAVKDPVGKIVNSPIAKKINKKTGLIFENAKCIKCGLCVRVCQDSNEEPALCLINRGFPSIISEPLTVEFDDIPETHAEKSIAVCPTGALSRNK
jgi:predicted molibdopterin-dependent oxidoreductase YjgC